MQNFIVFMFLDIVNFFWKCGSNVLGVVLVGGRCESQSNIENVDLKRNIKFFQEKKMSCVILVQNLIQVEFLKICGNY